MFLLKRFLHLLIVHLRLYCLTFKVIQSQATEHRTNQNWLSPKSPEHPIQLNSQFVSQTNNTQAAFMKSLVIRKLYTSENAHTHTHIPPREFYICFACFCHSTLSKTLNTTLHHPIFGELSPPTPLLYPNVNPLNLSQDGHLLLWFMTQNGNTASKFRVECTSLAISVYKKTHNRIILITNLSSKVRSSPSRSIS